MDEEKYMTKTVHAKAITKIEAGKTELYIETFNVQNMIQDIEGAIKPLVQKNNNKLTITYTVRYRE